MFRKSFVYDEDRAAEVMALDEREAIRDPRLLIQGLVVLALVVAGFVLHPVLHYEPSVVALLGAGLLVAISTVETGDVLSEVEWPTLAFFAGPVHHDRRSHRDRRHRRGLQGPRRRHRRQRTRRLHGPARRLRRPVRHRRQHPLRRHHGPHHRDLVTTWAAPATTSCGGPSPSAPTSAATPPPSAPAPTSSSSASPNATAQPISFWQFTKYGLVVTAVTVAISAAYLWLRYFALA